MSKRIAFIQAGPFSHANQSLVKKFRQQFPDFEIDVVDVLPMVMRRIDILLINLFFVLYEYGWSILVGKRGFKRSFFATTYMFKKWSKLGARHIVPDKHVFSFQTQSMFDASRPGVPHFMYTDHTALANLQYPDIQRRDELTVTERWLALEKTIYQNATLNFTMSNHISRSIAQDYDCPPDKIERVFAGSNVTHTPVIQTKRYDQKNILFVGVDWERKGGPQLLEAFKLVRQQHPDARLTIVGCSPEIDVPNCEVVGRVPKEEVGRYYENATVFCLPTRREPFGFVFIEAMAYKLPIVASNIGAIPDFVTPGVNGYTVGPDDVAGLAAALCELVADPAKCQAFGEYGYRTFVPAYSWDNVVRLIRDAVGKHVPLTTSAPNTSATPTTDPASSAAEQPEWATPRLHGVA